MNTTYIRNTVATTLALASIAIAPLVFAATPSVAATATLSRSFWHHVSSPQKNGGTHKELGGTVTAINGTTITISAKNRNGAKAYTVDASNAHFLGKKVTGVTDIALGDKIAIIGTLRGTTISANMIIDQTQNSPTHPASPTTPVQQ